MKAVIQRVSRAAVSIDGQEVSAIGPGLLILLGVVTGDTPADMERLADKTVRLRIFDDECGVMNRSVLDVGGEALVVSQFTLAARTDKGHRPSYVDAAPHETAIPLYEAYCQRISQAMGKPCERGRFGADMQVSLINDGPVTIIMDTRRGSTIQ